MTVINIENTNISFSDIKMLIKIVMIQMLLKIVV